MLDLTLSHGADASMLGKNFVGCIELVDRSCLRYIFELQDVLLKECRFYIRKRSIKDSDV
jgi:hypothetical protein